MVSQLLTPNTHTQDLSIHYDDDDDDDDDHHHGGDRDDDDVHLYGAVTPC